MIIYHPLKDVNHCVYRMINILCSHQKEISYEQLKVADFYYLFPHFLKDIKPWPSDIEPRKKLISKTPQPFEKTPNKKKLFFDLNTIQKQALLTLSSKGLIDIESFKSGAVKLFTEKLPEELSYAIENDDFCESDEFNVIVNGICVSKWDGPSGLKFRTGLMEYKYDE